MSANGLNRRQLLTRAAAGSALLKFGTVSGGYVAKPYHRFEDVYRNKWTWDRVGRSTHGTNCAGNCAFNVFIKDGVVWREEQQAMYEASGSDVPDYGPRGCNKGLRHAKYMYGKQRVLYPMKRVGKRGEGKWKRISWDEATTLVAQNMLDITEKYGPDAIAAGSGTQMSVKIASMSALYRFANITGVTVPEFYSGVGDLPTGVYMTLGMVYVGDTMASVYKSKTCLVWMSNPAVTRIPDAHFFWEARYNGTKVIAISPEFTPTAMHSSLWVNPKPGTDIALAMSFIHEIIVNKAVDTAFVCEQTDLPLLVREDTGQFLRATDMSLISEIAVEDNVFYMWDSVTNAPVKAPATGMSEKPVGRERRVFDTLDLGAIKPALEGSWVVETRHGPIKCTTAFERLKIRAAEHAPEEAAKITGMHPDTIRKVARDFYTAKPAMIYTGYAACKWLHGDMLQRAFILMLALTGNFGKEGSGLQVSNAPELPNMMSYAFAGIGPALRIISSTMWDYEHGKMKELNAEVYGQALADKFDKYYEESIREDYFPRYSEKSGWRMGIFCGNNGANWVASGNKWRQEALLKQDFILAMVPDWGMTAMHADVVLPIAHHYERVDIMFQARTPYLQALDECVKPLGESVDDWTAFNRILEKMQKLAQERGTSAFVDNVDGRAVRRDPQRYHDFYTLDGSVKSVRDVVQYLINTTPGVPKISVDEFVSRGMVRVNDSENTIYGKDSPYHYNVMESVHEKKVWETLTARMQFYIDHPWFLSEKEELPGHRDPLRIKGYPLQMMMGHARHGIHSMWRDDHLLLSLQRGEPDIYVNPDDAKARGVEDGDLLRIFNSAGEFYAQAHISAGIQPGMTFMYHGWDPMMFHGRNNFGSVISTAGLIKPTSMAGDYGHLGYRALSFAPNQTYKDFTCDFEKADRAKLNAEEATREAARYKSAGRTPAPKPKGYPAWVPPAGVKA